MSETTPETSETPETTDVVQPPATGTTENGFPANTPIAEMTAEQQAAYWRDKAQSHEKRLKAERERKAAEIEAARVAALPDQERAVAEAKAAGRAEALKEAGANLARAEFKAAAAGRLSPALIAALDTSPYINDDGTVDTDAIARFVSDNAPPPAAPADADTNDGKPDLPDFGQGRRGASNAASSDPLLADLKDRLNIA